MSSITLYPARAAIAVFAVLLFGAGAFLFLGRSGPEVTPIAPVSIDLRTTADAPAETAPAPVMEPSEFVFDFLERLNQVNAFVSIGSNSGKAPLLYGELWKWAAAGGVEVYGLKAGSLRTKLTEAEAYPLLELVTLEGNRFCVAEATVLDRDQLAAPYLRQGLYKADCSTMFADPAINR